MTTWAADTTLGPYVLVAPIGAGGRGEVWKTRDPVILTAKTHPGFDKIRDDPRFPALLRKMNLS